MHICAVTRLTIAPFLAQAAGALVLDVRSPAEYAHAHIPGAVSLPLFTDEERKVVGTAYKQESREAAIKIGLDYFGPKMRRMVEEVEAMIAARNPSPAANDQRPTANLFIYCWRGGMRSGAVSWLLNLYGFRVHVLAGGYKAFRNHVLQAFSLPLSLKIIGGYTGSGKTGMLQELAARGQTVIDLEGLASHKGSAFGNIDLPPQPTQEQFENRLALQLYAAGDKTIWMEDESQRIGHINIPMHLWNRMRAAPVYFFEIPFAARLGHLVAGYGGLNREKMAAAIRRISKRLGGLETRNALEHLEKGDLKSCFSILLQYYDKQYGKALHNRENLPILLRNIHCSSVDPAHAIQLIEKQLIHEKPDPSPRSFPVP